MHLYIVCMMLIVNNDGSIPEHIRERLVQAGITREILDSTLNDIRKVTAYLARLSNQMQAETNNSQVQA